MYSIQDVVLGLCVKHHQHTATGAISTKLLRYVDHSTSVSRMVTPQTKVTCVLMDQQLFLLEKISCLQV